METTKQTDNRTSKVITKLQTQFPTDHKINNLCSEFNDIFALDTDQMTVNNLYEQKLTIKDDEPVYTKNYRIPQTQKQEIDKQINKLWVNNLIENSKSCYNSPIILVPKKVQV